MAVYFKSITKETNVERIHRFFTEHQNAYYFGKLESNTEVTKELLIDSNNIWFYIVNEQGQNVGFFMLSIDGPYSNLETFVEIQIGVFDEFMGNNYAKESIFLFVQKFRNLIPDINILNTTLEAFVYQKNEYKDIIINLLDKLLNSMKKHRSYKEYEEERAEDGKAIIYQFKMRYLL